ncbi:hypothetical protein KXV47_007404 [Aspergillus fumigatus]|nr:hypothetical protein KXV47_007404 [Aspergillus fumigatus]
MRFLNLLLALSPLAQVSSAIPQEWGNSTGPLGGNLITDPARLSELHEVHNEVIRMLNTGETLPVERSRSLTVHGQHDKRVYQAFGLLGVFVASMFGLKTVEKITDQLLELFTSDDTIWTRKENCRAYFSTQGGGNEEFRTYARDHGNPTSEVHKNVGWIDPEHTAPPIHFFEGDQGDSAIGVYSVQYTATDRVAWSGIPDTEKCPFEGLCNPQYIFYHNGYQIVLNTWQSQGRISACQYSQGEDCLGLCSSGVKNQFSRGGGASAITPDPALATALPGGNNGTVSVSASTQGLGTASVMFGFWLYYYCDCNRVVETRPDQSTNAALGTGISGALMGVG